MDENEAPRPEWFLSRDGKQHGPISKRDLSRLAEQGKLRPDDLIWKAGFEGWRLVSSIPGLLSPPVPPSEQHAPSRTSQRRVWQIALGASVAAGAVAAIVYWLLVSQVPSPEQKALLASLTRLSQSTAQGVSFADYSNYLIDANTEYKLAIQRLSKDDADKVEKALDNMSKVKHIWQITAELQYRKLCPFNCGDILETLMTDLGIVKTHDDYNAYFKNYMSKWRSNDLSFDDLPNKQVVSDAVTKADSSLLLAISSLQ